MYGHCRVYGFCVGWQRTNLSSTLHNVYGSQRTLCRVEDKFVQENLCRPLLTGIFAAPILTHQLLLRESYFIQIFVQIFGVCTLLAFSLSCSSHDRTLPRRAYRIVSALPHHQDPCNECATRNPVHEPIGSRPRKIKASPSRSLSSM